MSGLLGDPKRAPSILYAFPSFFFFFTLHALTVTLIFKNTMATADNDRGQGIVDIVTLLFVVREINVISCLGWSVRSFRPFTWKDI